MTIGRSQISKQVEGKLSGARDEEKKKKKVKFAIKRKKNPIAKELFTKKYKPSIIKPKKGKGSFKRRKK